MQRPRHSGSLWFLELECVDLRGLGRETIRSTQEACQNSVSDAAIVAVSASAAVVAAAALQAASVRSSSLKPRAEISGRERDLKRPKDSLPLTFRNPKP
ncbi:hypothetical protein MUK42_29050 [Musa troglodytarum]|uniref:Uncharacterized protein n=1 Tax=Musa troglodytarum TaxID=320322 RepID=A0A9E7K0G9_9LILI|nr:hypothetical protein MUK42_29050 [Musa troglodytarum]